MRENTPRRGGSSPHSASRYQASPIDLQGLTTYPLASRPSKVAVRDFARPAPAGATFRQFFESMPHILAAQSLQDLCAVIQRARAQRRVLLWGIGGHVIKVGLAPLLIELLRCGFISGIAMNGAALVHDFEIALCGSTSEDVPAVLGRGKFGMAEETGRYLNEAARNAEADGIGLGEAVGRLLANGKLAKFGACSVLRAAYQARIPVTVHLAIGTDIPHMHTSASGAALGATTHYDFRLFCALVQRMQPDGVYLNWGSAVILPEIFLKAVAIARNLGTPLQPITTANFDFIQHYRPQQNVVLRPTHSVHSSKRKSRGFSFTGHHEIMMPLLAAALRESGKPSKPKRKKTRQ